jgi:uncharacterized protein Yka (UPF0111/DUF47 family)
MKFNIFDLLLPRETKFYGMLNKQAETTLQASEELRLLVSNLEASNNDAALKNFVTIKELSKSGDKLERAVTDELDKTFITPLDREDINRISMQLGIMLDNINSVSQMLDIYGIHQMPSAVGAFCDILVGICKEHVNLIAALQSRKGLNQIIRLMHEFEKRGDDVFHQGMAELFRSESPVEIIKFKSVYESLEDTIDSASSFAAS